MNAGKTTLSLGLLSWLMENAEGGATFMKPLGQKTALVDGVSVGEDTLLVANSLGLDIPLELSTPFSMSSGASRRYLDGEPPRDIARLVRRAYRKLREMAGIVVVEGTGHPGVGSVFGLSNADVASMLDVPVILVLDAGIGGTIDRFALCSSLFRLAGRPVAGVVFNRVVPGKTDSVRRYLDPWFEERGIDVLGYIPYVSAIARPSLGVLSRKLGVEAVIDWERDPDSPVEGFITGFGSSSEILQDVAENPERALILSTTRQDVVDAVLARRLSGAIPNGPGALVLCGEETGLEEHVAGSCRKLGIPLYRTGESLERSASRIHRSVFKLEPGESLKITEVVRTVRENVDISRLMESLEERPRRDAEQRPGRLRRAARLVSRLLSGGGRDGGGR